MGKIEYIENERVCIKSATKLMEQLYVHEQSSDEVSNLNIISIKAFGNDKVGIYLAMETEEQDILLYQPEPIDNSIKCLPVGLKGHDIAAGLDADGRICLFAVKGDRVYHVREKAPYTGQFTAIEEIPVTRPNTDSRIAGLTLYELENDSSYPFVLAISLSSEEKYWLDLHYCDSAASNLFPVPLTTKCFTFSGDKRAELKLHVIRDNYGIYDIETGKAESSIPINRGTETVAAETVKYISGNTFVLYKDSGYMKISALINSADGTQKELKKLFTAKNIHCFNAWGDEKNVFVAVHTDMICHGSAVLSDGVWKADDLDPLADSASILAAKKYRNAMQLFYITNKDHLLHKLEDMDGANWNETTYEAGKAGSVTRQSCYSTEMTFTDPKHKTVPLSGIKVTLTADSRTYVETAEGISMIDRNTSVTAETDSYGKLFFRQYSSRLDVPTIYANLSDNLLGDDEELSFSQFSDVYHRMGQVDGDTLLSAQQFDSKTAETSPLISDKYRTKECTDQLAKGIRQLVSSFNIGESNVMQLQKKGTLRDRILPNNNAHQAWHLQFMEDGSVFYEELTSQQAEELIINFSSTNSLGLPKWLSKIGDFFRSVVKSIVKVCEVVINGAKAAVRFILNGVEMVFETVLNVVQDVLKFVEIIFAPVLVLFKHIFRWIASLFGWNYVLYTKKAIVGMVNLLLDWLPQNASELSNFICSKIETAQTKIDSIIDEIIEKITSSGDTMDYWENQLPAENETYTYEISSDPIQAKFQKALASGADLKDIVTFEDDGSDGIEELFAELNSFIKDLSDSDAFDEAQKYLNSAFENMDKFFSFLLSGILSAIKGLIKLILNGCSKLVSDMFDTLAVILDKLKKLITAKISFPLLSEIYRWISDDDLTIIDLAALLTALPSTIIGKLVLHSVPFASEEDSAKFVERLKQKMKFTLPDSLSGKACVSKVESSDNDEFALNFTITMSALFYGMTDYALDKLSISGDGDSPISTLLAVVSLALQLAWLVSSFPAFYDNSSSTHPEIVFSWIMWIIFCIGMIIDSCYFFKELKHVDAEKEGRYITSIYGDIHLAFALIGGYIGCLDNCTLCGEIFSSAVEMSRFMLNIENLEKMALIIDAIGMGGIFITNLFSLYSDKDDNQYANTHSFDLNNNLMGGIIYG